MPRTYSEDNENMIKEPKKKNMDWEIWNYPCYKLCPRGRLVDIPLQNTSEYNHQVSNLHHYIPYNQYKHNRKWFQDRGIEQKLILMPTIIHEQLHFQAVNNVSDEEFERLYGISRWELVFNKKHSEY